MQILSYTASPQNISLASMQRIQNTPARVVGGSRTPNRTSNLATLSQLHWLPIHDRIKFKIATMTHKAISTCNPPYLANLAQWHTPSRNLRSASANLLSVTRCNISFGARGLRSAAPAIWNSLPSNVRSCETLTTFRRHLKSHLFHSAFATA